MTQLDVATGFEGGLAVVIAAIFLDRFTAALAEPSQGLQGRLRRRRRPAGAEALGAADESAPVARPTAAAAS